MKGFSNIATRTRQTTTSLVAFFACARAFLARTHTRSSALPACVLACALAYALVFPTFAFALEGSSAVEIDAEDNTVNARQLADNSFLYDTSIFELNNASAAFQGNTVQVVGEVVGEAINAEDDTRRCWITLESTEESDESSISVLVSKDTLALIDTYGGYNRVGTTLQVRGTFYLACPSHEGIMDIHAESVSLVAKGSVISSECNLTDFKGGAILVGIGLVLTLVYRYLRARER